MSVCNSKKWGKACECACGSAPPACTHANVLARTHANDQYTNAVWVVREVFATNMPGPTGQTSWGGPRKGCPAAWPGQLAGGPAGAGWLDAPGRGRGRRSGRRRAAAGSGPGGRRAELARNTIRKVIGPKNKKTSMAQPFQAEIRNLCDPFRIAVAVGLCQCVDASVKKRKVVALRVP